MLQQRGGVLYQPPPAPRALPDERAARRTLLAQVAQTRIAEQGVKTAEQQEKANEALAKSVSKDPNVLVSKCLDMVEGGKVTLPAGFSCWPSSGSAVVVPATGSSSK